MGGWIDGVIYGLIDWLSMRLNVGRGTQGYLSTEENILSMPPETDCHIVLNKFRLANALSNSACDLATGISKCHNVGTDLCKLAQESWKKTRSGALSPSSMDGSPWLLCGILRDPFESRRWTSSRAIDWSAGWYIIVIVEEALNRKTVHERASYIAHWTTVSRQWDRDDHFLGIVYSLISFVGIEGPN